MPHSSLAKLLVLHDRDQRLFQLNAQLKQWPLDRENTEREIAAETARVKQVEDHIKALESQRKDLEGQIAVAEEKIGKYRTQQLAVKKQDEYDALEKECATLRDTIDELETQELDILEELDESNAQLAEARTSASAAIATLEGHLRTLDEGLKQNQASVGEAKEALREARDDLAAEADSLAQYDFVRKQVKRFPIVVELVDGKCKGCHLKVSGEVESGARKGTDIVRCSSCGRIVYMD